MATKWNLDEVGTLTTKKRMKYDASFRPPGGFLVYDRIYRNFLTDCFFVFCLLRLIHAIQVMRLHALSVPIFITKLYLEEAYRKIYVTAKMALLTITVIVKLA